MKYDRKYFVDTGRIGGQRRAQRLSPEKRIEIAKRANKASQESRRKKKELFDELSTEQ